MGHLLLKGALLGPKSNPSWKSMTLVSSRPLAGSVSSTAMESVGRAYV